MYERIIKRKETIIVEKKYIKRNTYEYSKRRVENFDDGIRMYMMFPECVHPTIRTFKNGHRMILPPNPRKRKYYQGKVDRILHV